MHNTNLKFTLANVFSFGLIGSLIGGLLPSLMLSFMTTVSLHRFIINYVELSLIWGLIPATIAGYLYSRLCKKSYLARGALSILTELKVAALASTLSILSVCFFIWFVLMLIGAVSESASIQQQWNLFRDGLGIATFLVIMGLIAGVSCSLLIRRWNRKQLSLLQA